MSERSRGDFNSRCAVICLGMSRRVTSQLTEPFQFIHRQVISKQMKQDILQTTRMAVAIINTKPQETKVTRAQIDPDSTNEDFSD